MEIPVNNAPFLTLTCFRDLVGSRGFVHEKAFSGTCSGASCLFEESDGNSRVRVSTTTTAVCVWCLVL